MRIVGSNRERRFDVFQGETEKERGKYIYALHKRYRDTKNIAQTPDNTTCVPSRQWNGSRFRIEPRVWTRHLQCCFSESSVSICEIKFKFYYALCVSLSQSRKTTPGIPIFATFQLCTYVKFSFRVKVYVQQWNVNRLGKMKGSSCPLTVPS